MNGSTVSIAELFSKSVKYKKYRQNSSYQQRHDHYSRRQHGKVHGSEDASLLQGAQTIKIGVAVTK